MLASVGIVSPQAEPGSLEVYVWWRISETNSRPPEISEYGLIICRFCHRLMTKVLIGAIEEGFDEILTVSDFQTHRPLHVNRNRHLKAGEFPGGEQNRRPI